MSYYTVIQPYSDLRFKQPLNWADPCNFCPPDVSRGTIVPCAPCEYYMPGRTQSFGGCPNECGVGTETMCLWDDLKKLACGQVCPAGCRCNKCWNKCKPGCRCGKCSGWNSWSNCKPGCRCNKCWNKCKPGCSCGKWNSWSSCKPGCRCNRCVVNICGDCGISGCGGFCRSKRSCGCIGVCTCRSKRSCGCIGACTCRPRSCRCLGACTCRPKSCRRKPCGCVDVCRCKRSCGCIGVCRCKVRSCGCRGVCKCKKSCRNDIRITSPGFECVPNSSCIVCETIAVPRWCPETCREICEYVKVSYDRRDCEARDLVESMKNQGCNEPEVVFVRDLPNPCFHPWAKNWPYIMNSWSGAITN